MFVESFLLNAMFYCEINIVERFLLNAMFIERIENFLE
jgi:hypothetical protein